MLNRWIGMGRLTRDPELRTTSAGVSVANFTIACDRDYKTQDGVRETEYIDVVAWRHTAEFVCKYLSKGKMVVAEGRLQSRDWTDKNGSKRRSWEINADNVYFGEAKREAGTEGSYVAGYSGSYAAPAGMCSQPAENSQNPMQAHAEGSPQNTAFPESDYSQLDLMTDDDLPF